jgi:hypothetical protein
MGKIFFNGYRLKHYQYIYIVLDMKNEEHKQGPDDFYGSILINHDGLHKAWLEGTIYDIEIDNIRLAAFDDYEICVNIENDFLHIKYKSTIWSINNSRIILYRLGFAGDETIE